MMGASCTPAGGPPALAALFLTVAVASAACATARTGSEGPTDHLAADLTTLIDTLPAATASLPGALLRVEALTMNFVWTKAIGTADLATGVPLHFDQTLRIASNTKTFFAAAILRLAEEDALELDAAIATLIEPSSALLLESGATARSGSRSACFPSACGSPLNALLHGAASARTSGAVAASEA